MIDIKALEKNDIYPPAEKPYRDYYQTILQARGFDTALIDELLEKNREKKLLITEAETAKAEQNRMSQEIALQKKQKQDASGPIADMQKLSAQIKEMMHKAEAAEEEIRQQLLQMPNICHPSVPIGRSEEDNKVVSTVGEPTRLSFSAKDHAELGESLGIIDFERAGKVTGARFAFLRGSGSRLERALIQFMMDLHSTQHGYEEMIPPFIVNEASMFGTGQFPKFREDVFRLEGFEYYLIPTAEAPLTNYYAGEMLNESDLPQRFVAYSPCFRSEAGNYGRDTKGLIRQHQFNKVELFKVAHPEQSYEELDSLTDNAEEVLRQLELPYRKAILSTGDISFGAAKCYDLEVWLPAQEKYREISSCSNFEDFQARRANIRFRAGAKGKPQFVHTLNGSGLAVGRTLIAILENYQQEDGSVVIPKVLQPYMGGQTTISKA